MQPQGAGPVNPSYYADMTARVNAAQNCAELQAITTEICTSLNAGQAATTAQLANLAPIAALLAAPSSPSDVVTWITGFIEHVLTPLYAPAAAYAVQNTATAANKATLDAAITAKAATFDTCTVTIP